MLSAPSEFGPFDVPSARQNSARPSGTSFRCSPYLKPDREPAQPGGVILRVSGHEHARAHPAVLNKLARVHSCEAGEAAWSARAIRARWGTGLEACWRWRRGGELAGLMNRLTRGEGEGEEASSYQKRKAHRIGRLLRL